MKQLEKTIQSLTEFLLPVLRCQMAKLGVDASSAYNFYQIRLQEDRIFSDDEGRSAGEIAERLAPTDQAHGIGCG